MIVKVLEKGVNSYYQCKRAYIHHKFSEELKELDQIRVEIEDDEGKDGNHISLGLNRDIEIYIMNDTGKTIDAYRFQQFDSSR